MLAAGDGRVDSGRAAGLPAACNVRVGFIPTSPNFNCFSFELGLSYSNTCQMEIDITLAQTFTGPNKFGPLSPDAIWASRAG
uniref:Uncharacterized protein n=1 Tax=Oryza meridionalis TaxID=40149 RepID=A0A1V1H5K6_9ORYZ|nr:hypothetical protein [Oryza meridionalis]BAX24869.1 hypothetical protein [Oryza meridionalis]